MLWKQVLSADGDICCCFAKWFAADWVASNKHCVQLASWCGCDYSDCTYFYVMLHMLMVHKHGCLLSVLLLKPWSHWTISYIHTRLTALCPGLPRWAGTRKVKPIWILLKQETVSGSGISWAICKSAPRPRQITMPAPHCSVFLQAGCPSWRPTNSVKALNHITSLLNK